MNLKASPIGTPLKVLGIRSMDEDDVICRRLMELGFIEGAIVEVRHRAPLFGDPIAVMVRGMLVALRRYEAERVVVSEEIDSAGQRT
jgi:ferrous iron transport protein A